MIRRMFLKSLAPSLLGAVGIKQESEKSVNLVEVHVSTEKGWMRTDWDDVKPGHYVLLNQWDEHTSILLGFYTAKVDTIEPGPKGKFTTSEMEYHLSLPKSPHQLGEIDRLWKEGRVTILKFRGDSFPPLPQDMFVKDCSPHVYFQENSMACRIVCPRFPKIKGGNWIPTFETDGELLAYATEG